MELDIIKACAERNILTASLQKGLRTTRIIQTDDGTFKEFGEMVLLEPDTRALEYPPFNFFGEVNVTKEKWYVAFKRDHMSKWVIDSAWVYKYHSVGVVHVKDEIDEEE